MARTDVEICNMALGHIGAQNSITALDNSSFLSRQCNLWYAHSRRAVLEADNWQFSRKRIELEEHDDDPPDEWYFRYQYPADAIRVWYVERRQQGMLTPPFEVDSTPSILTNAEEAVAVYSFDQDDVTKFSSKFVDALSYYLAAKLAFPVTKKRTTGRDMMEYYERALDDARGNVEGQRPPQVSAPWVRARKRYA